MTPEKIAEKCLNKFWNSCATDIYGGGWDVGSPAHRCATAWVKRNYETFKKLSFEKIYKQYLIFVREE